MNLINLNNARQIAQEQCRNTDEESLVDSFVTVCSYLHDNPESLSWRGNKPDFNSTEGVEELARRYFKSYRRSDAPTLPKTVPDEMVSVIMNAFYGYSTEKCLDIKKEHQLSMIAENCVGNLLERYIDSQLRHSDWSWCCGEFVKAVDFIGKDNNGEWVALQIKNRNNSENSSSSAIREGTSIQKWFRSFSTDTASGRSSFTNWENLPPLMQGYGLSEEKFRNFVIEYLVNEKTNLKAVEADSQKDLYR